MPIKIAPCDMVVYKKLHYHDKHGWYQGVVAELIIPKGTKFHMSDEGIVIDYHLKCRAAKAFVVAFYEYDRWPRQITRKLNKRVINHIVVGGPHQRWKYKKNELNYPDEFDENHKECAGGIHFFFSPYEAINY